jgi:hypothetical protein
MKKYILAPLCSAFVIPGLGQILNHEIRKGVLILGAVFLLFVAGSIKLAFVVKSLLRQSSTSDPALLMESLKGEHLGSIWVLLAIFSLIWVYSVADAFLAGRRLERNQGAKGS